MTRPRRSLFMKYFVTLFVAVVVPLMLGSATEAWFAFRDNRFDLNELLQVEARSAAAAALRASNAQFIRDLDIESKLNRFHLTGLQHFQLQEWAAGRFQSDWQGVPQPGNTVTADEMTRAALQSTVGQGFFPGIEAGIIVKDPTLYADCTGLP